MVVYVEEVDRNLEASLCQHACHGQRVATVVAGAGEHDDGREFCPLLSNGCRECLRCPFHEVNRVYRLMLNGIFVKLMNLSTCKYFHSDAKIQKRNRSSVIKGSFFFLMLNKL